MITMMTKNVLAGLLLILMLTSTAKAADDVEVLHWWTSGGEAGALSLLKKDLEGKGIGWKDMPIAGGGGDQAMTVLRARVTSGNPPTAAQMLGYDILDWAKQGNVANLNELAAKEQWDTVVPKALQSFSKYNGKWIAAPVNVHSTNWVWANQAVFDKLGISQPDNWDELIAALDKIQEAGLIAVAHGGQAWQDATIFDAVLVATGGPSFYKKTMIDLDKGTLSSSTMLTVFDRMKKIRSYVDKNFSGRDWNQATAMVIEGKAGLQFMGDWAKGEFLNAGKVPGKDFSCFRFPGTQGTVTFNSDQFVMFDLGSKDKTAQAQLASSVLSPDFQIAFNKVKGSVPARTDIADDEFDDCGKKGMSDLAAANSNGSLFGSMAHGHAVPAAIKNAIYDVVTAHFNGEFDSATAVKELVAAIDTAQ